ncbi:hypothetical protein BD779DRAFT_1536073 [Infundibulicybe gibba]|nr:hypothetical protein BD779DRAFT_1536073 [Infundibulicybe gibba]
MENLPVEIVRAIFLELCSFPTTFPLHKSEPRLLVTRVCSRWRAIALSMTALWASYRIDGDSMGSCSSPQPGPIHAWISRAAQFPLSFVFRGPSPMIIDLRHSTGC